MTRLLASLLTTLFLIALSAAAMAAAPVRSAPAARPAAAPAAESPVPIWRRSGILVEQGGRALYIFTEDLPGQSRCDMRCEALWPPHYAEAGAKPHGPFTLATSFNGRPMWAWQGKPLYRWISDRRRGAAGGDGVAGVWFLVKVLPGLNDQVPLYRPMPTRRPAPRPPASTATATPRTSR